MGHIDNNSVTAMTLTTGGNKPPFSKVPKPESKKCRDNRLRERTPGEKEILRQLIRKIGTAMGLFQINIDCETPQ